MLPVRSFGRLLTDHSIVSILGRSQDRESKKTPPPHNDVERRDARYGRSIRVPSLMTFLAPARTLAHPILSFSFVFAVLPVAKMQVRISAGRATVLYSFRFSARIPIDPLDGLLGTGPVFRTITNSVCRSRYQFCADWITITRIARKRVRRSPRTRERHC